MEMERKQSIEIDQGYCGEGRVTVVDHNHTPGWKRYGHGMCVFDIQGTSVDPDRPYAGWVSFWIEETSFADRDAGQKRDVTRKTSISVGLEGARAIRDYLNKLDLGD